MTTAWRIPLSAHVCTPQDAPAVKRAAVYLTAVPTLDARVKVLHSKLLTLKPGEYREALMDGYWALNLKTNEWMQACIQRNGLLHYGVAKATALAQATRQATASGAAC